MNAVITGASRGLGLALVSRFAARPGAHVFAVARDLDASAELKALVAERGESVSVVRADVADADAGQTIAAALGSANVDLLINNAGVSGTEFGQTSQDDPIELFKINTFAPLLITQALRSKLAKNAKVVNITSVLGSIAQAGSGYFTYGMSKAALNMLTKKLAAELDGVAVLSLHPGWVRTRLGGGGAPLSVDRSADGMVTVIEAFDVSRSGAYLAYDGATIPW
jgi:NAD(P)-dependent dehydrogenase (short-subunit alcohol dehydrogenase family)